jgi:hypothetical protein
MSALSHGRAGPMLGAAAAALALALAPAAGAGPARDATTVAAVPTAPNLTSVKARQAYYASYGHPAPIARPVSATTAAPSRPSWLGFALAAGSALLLGGIAGSASVVALRRTRPAGFAG